MGTKFHMAFLSGFEGSQFSMLQDEKGVPVKPPETTDSEGAWHYQKGETVEFKQDGMWEMGTIAEAQGDPEYLVCSHEVKTVNGRVSTKLVRTRRHNITENIEVHMAGQETK